MSQVFVVAVFVVAGKVHSCQRVPNVSYFLSIGAGGIGRDSDTDNKYGSKLIIGGGDSYMEPYRMSDFTVVAGGTAASTTQVKKYLEHNPEVSEAFLKDPIAKLDEVVEGAAGSKPAYFKDRWIYRYVAIALGVAVLISAIGAILLALTDKTVPDILVAVASGAVGALAGLFAPRG